MGNDGGSIPDRRDLVKNKPKAEQADKANQTRARWNFCALSKKPLREPMVSCRLGRLYNKDAIIEFLLDRTLYGDGKDICGHVRSLKDVTQLSMTPNPAQPSNATDSDSHMARFVCPLTMKEMNGAVPFVYLRTCGCVLSLTGLRALEAAQTTPQEGDESSRPEKNLCPQCGSKYDPSEDIFTINPGADEETRMLERLAVYMASTKPKTKKRRAAPSGAEAEAQPNKKRQLDVWTAANPSMSIQSKKVTEGLAEEEKKRLASMSEAVKSIYKGKGDGRTNWISQGTFTRYAA